MEVDLLTGEINDHNFDISNVLELEIGYEETCITAYMRTHIIETMLQNFGPVRSFSVDPKFCQPFFKALIDRYGIKLGSRPASPFHKNGYVETR